eukprot:9502747-Pyramimonas_sp.AAC.2
MEPKTKINVYSHVAGAVGGGGGGVRGAAQGATGGAAGGPLRRQGEPRRRPRADRRAPRRVAGEPIQLSAARQVSDAETIDAQAPAHLRSRNPNGPQTWSALVPPQLAACSGLWPSNAATSRLLCIRASADRLVFRCPGGRRTAALLVPRQASAMLEAAAHIGGAGALYQSA